MPSQEEPARRDAEETGQPEPDRAKSLLPDGERPDGVACPYPGLSSFGTDDARWFFGRDRYLAELVGLLADLANLTARGPVVVVASSGAGKSSLLRAGLVQIFERGMLSDPGSRSWPRLVMTPTGRPLAMLAEKLAAATGLSAGFLSETVAGRPADTGRVVAESPAGQGSSSRIVLVIDQFEEVFTLCGDEAERAAFVAAVNALAEPPGSARPAALVVLGLRADFYARAADYPELRAALRANQLLLGPMAWEELREAIVSPARSVGLDLEAGLAELLIRDLGVAGPDDGSGHGGYEAGRLPLLAHALRATWQQRSGRVLTVDDYEKTGGISRAIAHTAERAYERLDEADQERSRLLFLRLTVIGDSGDDTRRRLTAGELAASGDDPEALARLIERYAAARLLSLDRDQVEITHEVLLRAWPRLREWIDADRDGLRAAQEAEDAAQAWERADRDQSLLYRGLLLDNAAEKLGIAVRRSGAPRLVPPLRRRAWPGAGQGAVTARLSPRAKGFLDASVRLRRRDSRLRRGAIAGLAALTLVAGSLAGYATLQRNQARSAQASAEFQQVTAEAGKLASTDTSLSAVLDAAAYRMHPTPGGYTNLLTTEQDGLATRLDTGMRAEGDFDVSPDGKLLAVKIDQGIQLWNIARPQTPVRVDVPPSDFGVTGAHIKGVSFDYTGRSLAVIGDTGGVRLWNLADPAHPAAEGSVPTPLPGTGEDASGGGFLGSGKFVLASATALQEWNVRDARRPDLEATERPCGDDPSNGIDSLNANGAIMAIGCGKGRVVLMTGVSSAHPVVAARFHVVSGNDNVDSIHLNGPGDLLAVASSADEDFQVWNIKNPGHPAKLGTGGTDTVVNNMIFIPGTPLLAVGDQEGTVSWWDVRSPVYSVESPAQLIEAAQPLHATSGAVVNMGLTLDKKNLIVAYSDGSMRIWHISQSVSTNTFPDESADELAFTGDGSALVGLHDTISGSQLQINQVLGPNDIGPARYFSQACDDQVINFSLGRGNGRNLFAAGCDDGSAELWDITDLRAPHMIGEPFTAVPPGYTIFSMAFSPSADTLAVGAVGPNPDDYASIRLWDITEPSAPRLRWGTVIRHSDLPVVAFAGRGNALAASDDNTGGVDVWNISGPSVTEEKSFRSSSDSFEGNQSPAVFVPRSPLLVNVNAANRMDVWNTAGKNMTRPSGELRGETDVITGLSVSRDGHWLVATDKDETIRLWHRVPSDKFVPYGNVLNPDPVQELDTAFSPVNDMFATLSLTGSVYLWDLDVGSAIDRICADTANVLTPSVWRQDLPGVPYQPPCG